MYIRIKDINVLIITTLFEYNFKQGYFYYKFKTHFFPYEV